MKTKILLGDTVRCKYTGIKGVAMARTEFINSCVQFNVCPKYNPKSPAPIEMQEVAVDEQSLILVKKGERHKKETKEEYTGGAMRRPIRMRGF